MQTTNKNSGHKKNQIMTLIFLYSYMKENKNLMLIAITSLIITSISVLLIGKSLEYIIDYSIAKDSLYNFNNAMSMVILLITLLAIGTCARFYSITLLSEKVVAKLRKDLYQHLLQLKPLFFEIRNTGDILSIITTDTTLLQSILSTNISMALRNTLLLIGSLVMLFTANMQLTMIMLLVIPLVVMPIVILGKKVKQYSKNSQQKVGMLNTHVEETIFGIKIVQAYNREKYELTIFGYKIDEVMQAAKQRINIRSILTFLVIMLVFGSIALVLYNGIHDILSDKITAGELSSFIFLCIVAAGATGALTDTVGELNKASGICERLIDLLEYRVDTVATNAAIQVDNNKRGGIEFRNITFFYPSRKNKAALDKISFMIKPGHTTAFVGCSGAGKSTILQLLMRFYHYQSGSVLFDHENIENYCIKSIRKQFAYVQQDPVIFSDTIYNNIAYGNLDATYEQVVDAAKTANALEFIEKLPEQFHSFIGQKGVRLSGGQKQRIAIARAILKNARILLFDEATSSLDAANERVIMHNISKLKDKTIIIVAHRLSTVKSADKILVLKNGQLLQQGRHEQLLENSTEYKRLLKAQFTD